MESALIKTAQLLLSLSLLVIIHELGHFFFARLFKTRVEKFYLFFDPWFSLWKTKRGDTEYGVGWLPLGGYVKIAGMIDESMDKEAMKLPPQPWEFRSKPAWQRLLIMVGGVLMNFLAAFLIYVGVLYAWGEEYLPTANVKYGIVVDETGEKLGFRNGDRILAVDHHAVENFAKIVPTIVLDKATSVLHLDFMKVYAAHAAAGGVASGIAVAKILNAAAVIDRCGLEGEVIRKVAPVVIVLTAVIGILLVVFLAV